LGVKEQGVAVGVRAGWWWFGGEGEEWVRMWGGDVVVVRCGSWRRRKGGCGLGWVM
jgi:hypothetical protein